MLPQLSLLTSALVGFTAAQQWGSYDTSAYPGGECGSDADCSDGKQCVYTYCIDPAALSSVVSSLTSANTELTAIIPTSFPASANIPTEIVSKVYTEIPTGVPSVIAGGGFPTWGPSHTGFSDWIVSSDFPDYPTGLPGWGSSAGSSAWSTSIPKPTISAFTQHTTAVPSVPLVTAPVPVPSVGSTTILHGKNATSTSGTKTTKGGNTPTGPTTTAASAGTRTNSAGTRAVQVGSVLAGMALVMGVVL